MDLRYSIEEWKTFEPFSVSGQTFDVVGIITVEIDNGEHRGRGECCPLAMFSETLEHAEEELRHIAPNCDLLDRQSLLDQMRAGPARNAVDCALWDFEAKVACKPIWDLCGLPQRPQKTVSWTIGLGDRRRYLEQVNRISDCNLIKIKAGSDDDIEILYAARDRYPNIQICVDANGGLREDNLREFIRACEDCSVLFLEQPLPPETDSFLSEVSTSLCLIADESYNGQQDIPRVRKLYDGVNIKLDKVGGLTAGLSAVQELQALGLKTLVGTMFCTSLGCAPATVLATVCDWADLDGPSHLRPYRYSFDNINLVTSYDPRVWG